jgi:uncharacterized repeat protein (TIGR01451 family)
MATFQNQATLTYGDNVTTSNVVTGELQQAISVTKYSVTDTYTADEVLTYVISLVNGGSTSLTDLTVTDNLGGYFQNGSLLVPLEYVEGSLSYYLNGTRQGAPVFSDTSPLVITGITVPANSNAFLVYQARVNEFAPPAAGGTVTNTATVTGAGIPAPITATETVNASSEAFLTIAKSLNPTTVSEGDRLTYTFVIQNFGNTPVVATDDAVVTDNFDPILSDLAVSFNGAIWTEGVQYTYDETAGAFATIPANITVPAATYSQNPATGAWSVVPGVSTLVVVGTV